MPPLGQAAAAQEAGVGVGRPLFIILCASGFGSEDRVRSALMFAALAASADYRTVLYCVQDAVDVMVAGAVARRETPRPGLPSIAQRLAEAVEMGVEIQCCTQSMANRGIAPGELIEGATPSGAMSLIVLAASAHGTISF